MSIVDDLIGSLDIGATPKDIRVGAYWTSVVMARGGKLQAGLSATLHNDSHPHKHPPMRSAGFIAGKERVRVGGIGAFREPCGG